MSHVNRNETRSQNYSGHHGGDDEDAQESNDGSKIERVTEEETVQKYILDCGIKVT